MGKTVKEMLTINLLTSKKDNKIVYNLFNISK